jgi:RNA polymerase sigma-70 factor (ECF subfamily)
MTLDADRLFRAYHETLVRYLTRRLGDRDWAEEVAQETFVRALRQPSLDNERSWLFAVATNLVRDEARKTARQRQHLQLLAAEAREQESSEPEELEEMTAERAKDAACARRALDSLAEKDRQALLLKAEGLDYEEIATVLEIEKTSVGTTLSRARRRLAETYDTLLTAHSQSGSENNVAS